VNPGVAGRGRSVGDRSRAILELSAQPVRGTHDEKGGINYGQQRNRRCSPPEPATLEALARAVACAGGKSVVFTDGRTEACVPSWSSPACFAQEHDARLDQRIQCRPEPNSINAGRRHSRAGKRHAEAPIEVHEAPTPAYRDGPQDHSSRTFVPRHGIQSEWRSLPYLSKRGWACMRTMIGPGGDRPPGNLRARPAGPLPPSAESLVLSSGPADHLVFQPGPPRYPRVDRILMAWNATGREFHSRAAGGRLPLLARPRRSRSWLSTMSATRAGFRGPGAGERTSRANLARSRGAK